MKPLPPAPATASETSRLKRRGMLIGAGATAAAGVAGALALRSPPEAPAAARTELARAGDGEGYRLSEHVRRYYETART